MLDMLTYNLLDGSGQLPSSFLSTLRLSRHGGSSARSDMKMPKYHFAV